VAEATTPKTRRHITSVTIKDDGSPAVSYAIPVHGELTYTPGGYALVESRTSKGAFSGVGPVLGTENPTTFSIECYQRGLTGSDSAPVLKDFLDSLTVGTGSDTTGSEPAGAASNHMKMFDVVVVTTDEIGTETLTFENCTFVGSSYATNLDDRNTISISGISRKAYPTVSFA
jgi:hypothetical protein